VANLHNHRGEKLRFGKAGVQKALMDPDRLGNSKQKNYAMVWNDEDGQEVYISRMGAGQRSCDFNVTWWEKDKEESKDFEFKDRTKAINLFLRKVKDDLRNTSGSNVRSVPDQHGSE
jgi:hypothetical protein